MTEGFSKTLYLWPQTAVDRVVFDATSFALIFSFSKFMISGSSKVCRLSLQTVIIPSPVDISLQHFRA